MYSIRPVLKALRQSFSQAELGSINSAVRKFASHQYWLYVFISAMLADNICVHRRYLKKV